MFHLRLTKEKYTDLSGKMVQERQRFLTLWLALSHHIPENALNDAIDDLLAQYGE